MTGSEKKTPTTYFTALRTKQRRKEPPTGASTIVYLDDDLVESEEEDLMAMPSSRKSQPQPSKVKRGSERSGTKKKSTRARRFRQLWRCTDVKKCDQEEMIN